MPINVKNENERSKINCTLEHEILLKGVKLYG